MMQDINVLKRGIGVNFDKDGLAEIRVWAPDATQVCLVAESLSLELQPDDFGYWTAISDLIKPGMYYEFVLDNGRPLPDPAALAQPDGVHGRSMAMRLDYGWNDLSWQNIPLQDYIFYELHPGTFTAVGDFNGVADRLDHLILLGVTAIELMPVATFPGKRNWGYDGVFPFAVQESYGGLASLQRLVDLCHQKGLAVVLDVVYNHLGPEGNCLAEFGPYFTDKYKTPWGNALNFDDQDSDGVRAFFVENALMWFRDFHVDALRLDAVHAIKDFGAVHILQQIRTYTDLLIQQTGRMHYLIAECDLNDPRYITPVEANGLGMDAQWVDEFHHALRVSAGEPAKGYYKDFSGIRHLAKSYKDAYVYTDMYSKERKKTFGRSATGHAPSQFVVFSQNHDQTGNRMLGERTSMLFSFELYKLFAAAVLFSPYLPMLFMGEEWGETNPFLYFVNHGDEGLIEMVRAGRGAEFAEMFSEGSPPDPQDEATFMHSKLNWNLLSEDRHACIFRYYQRLIALRKRYLSSKNTRNVVVLEEDNCLLLEQGTSGQDSLVWCVMNFSAHQHILDIPGHILISEELLNSAAAQWLGTGSTLIENNPKKIIVQPESFIAYTARYV